MARLGRSDLKNLKSESCFPTLARPQAILKDVVSRFGCNKRHGKQSIPACFVGLVTLPSFFRSRHDWETLEGCRVSSAFSELFFRLSCPFHCGASVLPWFLSGLALGFVSAYLLGILSASAFQSFRPVIFPGGGQSGEREVERPLHPGLQATVDEHSGALRGSEPSSKPSTAYLWHFNKPPPLHPHHLIVCQCHHSGWELGVGSWAVETNAHAANASAFLEVLQRVSLFQAANIPTKAWNALLQSAKPWG